MTDDQRIVGTKHEFAREVLSGSSVLISMVKRGLLAPTLLAVVSVSPRAEGVHYVRHSESS